MVEDEIKSRPKPVVLAILGGWGVSQNFKVNTISVVKTPTIDGLIKTYPAMTLSASGEDVGLAKGQPGNSISGHLNLGAGRIVYQNLSKINKAIEDGSFFDNESFLSAIKNIKKSKGSLHLIGLASSGKIHSSVEHLYALLALCKRENLKKVYLHLFTDGRDSDYNSGLEFVKKIQQKTEEYGTGEIASISGRFYAMDRDFNWQRTALAYRAIIGDEAENYFDDPVEAITSSYENGIYDEEFVPIVIVKRKKPVGPVKNGDSIIFFNFRADRVRQIFKAFVLPGFNKFPREYLRKLFVVGMVNYEKNLSYSVAFTEQIIETPLAKAIGQEDLKQLQIAEIEKNTNLNFFFNGRKKEDITGLDKVSVNQTSKNIFAKPGQSIKEMTKRLSVDIMNDKYDFMVIDYGSIDVLAHRGDIKATIKSCQAVDDSIKRLVEMVLAKNGVILITADHGNAEEIVNTQSGEINQDNSTNPVPFIIVGKDWEGKTAGFKEVPNSDLSLIKPIGRLADVAPTILKILDIEKPVEMTGNSLI